MSFMTRPDHSLFRVHLNTTDTCATSGVADAFSSRRFELNKVGFLLSFSCHALAEVCQDVLGWMLKPAAFPNRSPERKTLQQQMTPGTTTEYVKNDHTRTTVHVCTFNINPLHLRVHPRNFSIPR